MADQVVVLAGGVGAARFLQGLVRVVAPAEVTVIGNTGDDVEIHGLSISPDLDTVTYTLAGMADPKRGWGLQGDTFACLEALGRLTAEAWFQLGDRDLATHLYRTSRLRSGSPLSDVAMQIARALGVQSRILPMSDSPVRTWIETDGGKLDFQTYFVKYQARDRVRGVEFVGAETACPGPGVQEAIATARAVIVAPSNPVISIGPILAVPGIREALRENTKKVVAISPIVAGRAVKGPTAKMMSDLGMAPNAVEVARLYRDFLHTFVMDEQDAAAAPLVEGLGVKAVTTQTIMSGLPEKESLARAAVEAVDL